MAQVKKDISEKELKIALFEPKFLTSRPNSGSYLIIAQNQARNLARQGHQVLVFTERDVNKHAEEEPNLVIHALRGVLTPLSSLFSANRHRIPTYSPLFSPDIIFQTVRKLRQEKVDIIYGCGTSFMAAGTALLASWARLPSVHYVFQYAGPWKWWRGYLDAFKEFKVPLRYTLWEAMKNSLYQPLRLEAIHRWGLRRVNRVIACSLQVRETLLPYGLKEENIPVLYPSVEIPAPAGDSQPIASEVTYMGHLWQGRGVLDLVKAFSKVAAAIPEAKLKVAITNAERLTEHYFEALIKEYQLQDRVIQCGIVQDPYSELIAPSSVIVFPYRDMPSIKLLEVMAAAKAVITTNIDWIPELIQDGQNGFLVEPGDVEGLAQRIKMVLKDKELAKSLGEKARQTAQEMCSLDKNTGKLTEFLLQTIREGPQNRRGGG